MKILSFNSRPHKEVDDVVLDGQAGATPFNSRPHKEVDEFSVLLSLFSSSFNSRPHKEVDVVFYDCIHITIIFQFTTSQGGRPGEMSDKEQKAIFQFTTSQGGRPVLSSWLRNISPFNSRPHKEVDRKYLQ